MEAEYLPYKSTGKEMDEARTIAGVSCVGLYYYGARYLDPKYSRWISTDPALGEYIPKAPVNEEAKKYNQNLPGMGGVFNVVNLQLYHYAGNNPVKYTDPTGMYDKDEFKAFRKNSAEEQMTFLKEAKANGTAPSEMRQLRSSMKLKKLFKIDAEFMNEELRDYLNQKDDGTEYTLDELTGENGKKNGWTELCSMGSQYHQSKARDNNHLNAKFVNKDGREVVINKDRIVSNSYPDKGTFNYVNGSLFSSILWGGHNLYDIKPYERLMSSAGISTTKKYNGFFSGGAWYGNSHYWK